MTLKRRIEHAERSVPADDYAGWSEEQLRAEFEHRTGNWTIADWAKTWRFASEFGWSDHKISQARTKLGV